MKKVFRAVLVLAILFLIVMTGVYFYSKNQQDPIKYKVEKAEYRDIIKKSVATGSIVPEEEIEIKPVVSGIVDKLYVEAGDYVKPGELIARIRIVPNLVNLNNAEARVKTAEINKNEAYDEFSRQKSLYEQEIISEQTYRQALYRYERLNEELKSARDNLQLVREGATSDATQASNLVRSTVEGMVLDVPVKEGASVIEANNFHDGTTIAAVADLNRMIFEGKVDESEVGKLKEGMDLILTIGALPEQEFKAILEHIAPKGVQEEGAIKFEIKARVNLSDSAFIRAGYSANADIVLDRRDSVLALSESVLQFDDDGFPYIEIATGEQQFERRDLKTGISDGLYIEILEGLDAETGVKGAEISEEDKKPDTEEKG